MTEDEKHKGKIYNPFGKVEFNSQKILDIKYILQSLADTVSTFDGSVEFFKSLADPQADSAQVSDVLLLELGKFFTDNPSAAETVAFAYGKGFSDSAQTGDTSLAYNLAMQLADAADVEDLVGVPDGITYQYAMTKADAASLSDVFSRTVVYKRSPADSSQTSDALSYNMAMAHADSSQTSDAPAFSLIKPLADATSGVADASVLSTGLAKADTASLNDVLAHVTQFNKAHGDTSNVAEAAAISFTKVLADTVTLVDSGGFVIGFQYDQNAGNDSSSTSDAPVIAFGKAVSESLNAADAFARVVTYARAPAETVDAADAPVLALGMGKADSAQATESIILTQGQVYGDSASATDAPVRAISLVKADTADAEDLVGVPDGITYQYNATKADTANAAESLARAWTALRSFADSAGTADTPVVATAFNKPGIADTANQADSGQIFRLNYFDSDYVVASSTGPYNAIEIKSFT